MADFETGDVVRLGAAWDNDGSGQVVNVFHLRIESGAPMAFAQAALDFQEYLEDLYTPLLGWYSTGFTSDRISVKNETQDTVWGAISWGSPLAGTSITEVLAPQLALIGWGRTSISRVQLRKYWGPFTNTANDNGGWSTGIRADFQDAMDYLITEQTMTEGLELIGVAYNKTLDRATAALTATTSGNPVVQRRRRSGRGA